MANQNSTLCYVPQPYFVDGTSTIAGGAPEGVLSIENSAGIFDPDLSNFMTVNAVSGETSFSFVATFGKIDAHLAGHSLLIGCIGCALTTYEDDGGGNADLATAFSEDILAQMSNDNVLSDVSPVYATYAHNSSDDVSTFDKQPLPGIISGGQSNILFSGLGGPSGLDGSGELTFTFIRSAAAVAARPHAALRVGHLFIGVELPIIIDPNTFAWPIISQNQRFSARDLGAKSSEGTLLRQASYEAIKIPQNRVIGSQIDTVTVGELPDTISFYANFFDLIKSNTSYPLLFNPYPAIPPGLQAGTADAFNLTARQNFFSIYGFLDGSLELQTAEFRDGLNSEYRARFRVRETR